MTPSPFQLAFFSEISSGTSGILLEAAAGSGKTTTIVQGASLLPRHYLNLFLAFNKKIAEELQAKLPSFVQSGTFHSRGFSALARSQTKAPRVDKDKVRKLLRANLSYKDSVLYSNFVAKLVDLAKSAGLGTKIAELNQENLESLATHFGLSLDDPRADPARAFHLAELCLTESNSSLATIDFSDMLYLPLKLGTKFDRAQHIFVDEAQDTNAVQLELLRQMLAESGRLFAVGDPHQAIYAFRGADASAMDNLRQAFSLKTLPLSICYRCSKAVVAEAQKYL